MSELICSSCKENSVIDDYANGVSVCTSCGTVNDNQILDTTPEWSYGAEEAANSCTSSDGIRRISCSRTLPIPPGSDSNRLVR